MLYHRVCLLNLGYGPIPSSSQIGNLANIPDQSKEQDAVGLYIRHHKFYVAFCMDVHKEPGEKDLKIV